LFPTRADQGRASVRGVRRQGEAGRRAPGSHRRTSLPAESDASARISGSHRQAPANSQNLRIVADPFTWPLHGHGVPSAFIVAVNNEVLALILGGGQGTRLFPLTQLRSKPAVPIGGKYRLIDIPISNCMHADIRRIFVLTQFNSASLNRHIAQAYRMDLFSQGFVEILAAELTPDNPHWYQGTADAVRQAARHFA